MTPENIQKLETAYMNDMNDVEACLYAGIGTTALYDYQKENPEFADRKVQLRSTLALKAKMNIAEVIKKGDVKQSEWWLERRRKDEFSTRVEKSGPNGGPQNHVMEVPKPIIIRVHSVAKTDDETGGQDGTERPEHSGTVPPVI